MMIDRVRPKGEITMFSLEMLYRQTEGFRQESIRRAEYARLVKLVLDARRLLHPFNRQDDKK